MARRQIDIRLDNHSDVAVVNGDFAMVESTGEHFYQLVLANKNDFKQNPTIGVGLVNYLDDDRGLLPAAVVDELRRDGVDVNKVVVKGPGDVEADGAYR